MSDWKQTENDEKPRRLADFNMSPLDSCCLALGCIIGWGAFTMPGATFLPTAGPLGTAIALLAAAAMVSVIALNYHFMANEMPVEGGAYSYAARTFGPKHGFICAWFLMLAYLALVPYNASALTIIERDLFGCFLQYGPCYSLLGHEFYAVELFAEIVAVVVIVLLVGCGKRLTKYIQIAMGVALVACVFAVSGSGIALSSAEGVELAPLFGPTDSAAVGMLSILSVAPWAFAGFDAIPQTMGAVSFSPRKVGPLMIGVIAVAVCMYIALNVFTACAVPAGYASWVDYVQAAPQLTGLMSQPAFYAAYSLLGQPGYVALEVATLCAVLMGIVGFSFVVSRLIWLMADSKALPEWFGALDGGGAPVHALILVAISSVVAVFVGRTVLTWVVDVSSIGIAIAFGYTSAAVFKRARERLNLAKMVFGAVGAILSLAFIALLIAPVQGSGIDFGAESYVILLAWIALGINFYNPAATSS